MDKRNTYRIMKRWSDLAGQYYWHAEYRPWYWPFYVEIATRRTEEFARLACDEHAADWEKTQASEDVEIKLGRLP